MLGLMPEGIGLVDGVRRLKSEVQDYRQITRKNADVLRKEKPA
jgi:hypothetical protein